MRPRRVMARCPVAGYDRVHAYGDTPEDHAMLAMAHVRHYRRMPLPGRSPAY